MEKFNPIKNKEALTSVNNKMKDYTSVDFDDACELLESIGVRVMNSSGNMRSVYSILEDISVVWETESKSIESKSPIMKKILCLILGHIPVEDCDKDMFGYKYIWQRIHCSRCGQRLN